MKARVPPVLLVVSGIATACSPDNPARPSVSFAAPLAQQPSNGQQFNFTQQPVTVTIVNAVKTGSSTVTYNVELSKVQTFASILQTISGVAEGTNGTTSVQLPALEGNTTYYWRSRAVIDEIAGEPSSLQSFFVRPNVVILQPQVIQPTSGQSVFSGKPTFTVKNASRTGPADTLFYQFEVSASEGFGSTIATATIQEQGGLNDQTSWVPASDLPEGGFFWRVRARDVASGVDSPYSSAVSFERKFGIDINKAVIAFGPTHVATWPETAHLYNVYFDSADDQILCTEYTNPGWPDTLFTLAPPEENARVAANQWVFVLKDGIWYAGVSAWMRSTDQFCKRDYDQTFFMDSLGGRYPFNQTVLHSGDIIGVMMSTPARAWPEMSTRDERSNILLVAWPQGR